MNIQTLNDIPLADRAVAAEQMVAAAGELAFGLYTADEFEGSMYFVADADDLVANRVATGEYTSAEFGLYICDEAGTEVLVKQY